MEVYSYLFAKLIICSAADEILVSRWAQAEAALAEKRFSIEGENLEIRCMKWLKILLFDLHYGQRKF